MTGSSVDVVLGDTTEVRLRATFPSLSPAVLFDYFTVPERLMQWWPQAAEVEPRAGGRYRLLWPAMDWELFGHYRVYERAQRLAFSWQWKHEPNLPMREVDITFAPEGDGSRLAITHGTYTDSEVDQGDRQSHIDGWQHFLSRLQELVP